jgi:hypothetical protein
MILGGLLVLSAACARDASLAPKDKPKLSTRLDMFTPIDPFCTYDEGVQGVDLWWANPPYAQYYQIDFSSESSYLTTSNNFYTISDLSAGTYTYRVRAFHAGSGAPGWSDWSSTTTCVVQQPQSGN